MKTKNVSESRVNLPWSDEEYEILALNITDGIETDIIYRLLPSRESGGIEKKALKINFGVKTDKDGIKRFYYGVKRRQVKSCRAIKIQDDEEITTNNPTSSITSDCFGNLSDVSISKSDVKTKSDKDINIEAIEFLEDNKLIANIENIYRASLMIKERA